jgi:hypothetical protein
MKYSFLGFVLLLIVGCASTANVLDHDQHEIELYGFSNSDYMNIEEKIINIAGYKNHNIKSATSLKKNIIYTSSLSSSNVQKEFSEIINLLGIPFTFSLKDKKFSIKSKNIRVDK